MKAADDGLFGEGRPLAPALGALIIGTVVLAVEPTPSNIAVGIGAITGMFGAIALVDRWQRRPMFWRRPGPRWSKLQWIALYISCFIVTSALASLVPASDFLGWRPTGEALYVDHPDRMLLVLAGLAIVGFLIDAAWRVLRRRRARDIR